MLITNPCLIKFSSALLVTFHVFLSLQLLFFNHALAAELTFNIISLGAKPDGKTDASSVLQMTWAKACDSSTPATVYVPDGIFYVRSVSFNGPCKNNVITVLIDGTLVASSDIQVLAKTKSWIEFSHIDGLSITGGTIDGQGTALWNCKHSGKSCPVGATSLQINDAQNVNINGLSSINSQKFNIVVHGCQNVHMTRVNVSAADDSPNTDGIHVQQSSDVTILNSSISNGDDCISISPGTSNLWMESITCGPGHGISIGSLGIKAEEDGVHNVTLTLSTFTGTQNGVRIKSWGRPSRGFATKVYFQHIIMDNVKNPIIIDQNYCPHETDCPGQASGVKVSEVTYEDIKGTSATEIAINFDCSPINHCTGLSMKDINLTYENHIAKASCKNAEGTTSGVVEPSGCLADKSNFWQNVLVLRLKDNKNALEGL
ncbi:polygalacturonase-like [Cucurbita maxima]|uniref:Polygalacturonase-like n=1 Tax=Cucurbita maxima TaxID=3661 RepID=A0A6J1IAV1_CUCMA|nr:polygalacturonase-like [Cucurbita maxima]